MTSHLSLLQPVFLLNANLVSISCGHSERIFSSVMEQNTAEETLTRRVFVIPLSGNLVPLPARTNVYAEDELCNGNGIIFLFLAHARIAKHRPRPLYPSKLPRHCARIHLEDRHEVSLERLNVFID